MIAVGGLERLHAHERRVEHVRRLLRCHRELLSGLEPLRGVECRELDLRAHRGRGHGGLHALAGRALARLGRQMVIISAAPLR